MEEKIISVEQMRKSDAYTIENFVESKELMYRAAMGVYESYGEWRGKKIAIVVGGGNNGGDGYALAGILKKNGIDSDLIKVSDKMSADGQYYWGIAKDAGVKVFQFVKGESANKEIADKEIVDKEIVDKENTDKEIADKETADKDGGMTVCGFDAYDVIVDCILGTGFQGEVRGKAKDAIEAINGSSAYVISVDINSGMNGDTGEAFTALKSDLTVSIGFLKKGLVTDEAKKYIGRLVNVDIGIVLVEE